MPALTFFTLLNDAYSIQAGEYRMQANIALLAYSKEEVRAAFFRELKWASDGASAILNTSDENSSIDDIKKIFKG